MLFGGDCRRRRSLLSANRVDRSFFVAEYGRGEGEQLAVWPSPRARREARLPAGLVEEPLAVPAALGRHLREQEAAAPVASNDQAMQADLDRVRRDRAQFAEHGDMQAETGELGGRDGMEAAVVDGRGHGRPRDGLVEAIQGLRHPDASAELAVSAAGQGDERAATTFELEAQLSELVFRAELA